MAVRSQGRPCRARQSGRQDESRLLSPPGTAPAAALVTLTPLPSPHLTSPHPRIGVRVACAHGGGGGGGGRDPVGSAARRAIAAMSRRYRHAAVEAGVGALMATSVFVMHGQVRSSLTHARTHARTHALTHALTHSRTQHPAEALSYAAYGALAAVVIDEAVNGGSEGE